MDNENSPAQSSPSPSARRSSFSPGQKISELFGRSPNTAATGTAAYPSPIATAAANAQAQQRRRMSISSLGLSGSPTQPSAFPNGRVRQESVSSGGSGAPSIDESAIEEGDAPPSTTPSSPFARRMSFGARALWDVKGGPGNVNGRAPISSVSSPSAKGRNLSTSFGGDSRKTSNDYSQRSGEGFNWSEGLRSRAERSASTATSPTAPGPGANPREHQRAASMAAVEQPIKEMPKSPKAPDHFQERILKGDFYMD